MVRQQLQPYVSVWEKHSRLLRDLVHSLDALGQKERREAVASFLSAVFTEAFGGRVDVRAVLNETGVDFEIDAQGFASAMIHNPDTAAATREIIKIVRTECAAALAQTLTQETAHELTDDELAARARALRHRP